MNVHALLSSGPADTAPVVSQPSSLSLNRLLCLSSRIVILDFLLNKTYPVDLLYKRQEKFLVAILRGYYVVAAKQMFPFYRKSVLHYYRMRIFAWQKRSLIGWRR